MSVITLLTDFGLKDGNVGAMKGVILGIAPDTRIADLSHNISPQNIYEAALILARAAPYFPPSTIHVVVVDPGVGTPRRALAAQLGEQKFVGPDNGVISMLLDRTEKSNKSAIFYHLDQSQFWLPSVSNVFHGRDIFAPVGAHLAAGARLEKMGTPISDPVRLDIPQPERTSFGWGGEVIHIDHFGNLSTNITHDHLEDMQVIKVLLGGEEMSGLVRTFGDRSSGELVALFGSTGNLIISVVNGSAAQTLEVDVGGRVEVHTHSP